MISTKIMNKIQNMIIKANACRRLHQTAGLLENGLYEPDYLAAMKPKVPMYDTLNIQLKGYDYSILENYQKFLHNMMKNLDVNVEEAWATPHQEIQVTTLKPNSEIVNAQYNLKYYDRTVQITDISSTQLPIILRTIEASTPVGVTVSVVPHEEWHEEVRYVPDTELEQLKQQLEDMGGPTKKK